MENSPRDFPFFPEVPAGETFPEDDLPADVLPEDDFSAGWLLATILLEDKLPPVAVARSYHQ